MLSHARFAALILATGCAATLGVAALTPVAGASGATEPPTTNTVNPNAPDTGTVRGALSGADATQAAGSAGHTFRLLRNDMRGDHAHAPADQIHVWWGPETQAGNGDGEMATQSVVSGLAISNPSDVVYAPTMKPTDGSCIEVVTAYTNQGPQLWSWDWCGSSATSGSPAKVLPIDATFLSTYTTSVDGHPAYTVRDAQTDAQANTWTASLYNYQTKGWDTFYTSSGSDQSGLDFGWDLFEIYATQNPATGNAYYCSDAAGKAFDSSGIQIHTASGWQAVTPADSPMDPTTTPNPSDYECGTLRFQLPTANSHWLVQN